jgi:hypothetical protein
VCPGLSKSDTITLITNAARGPNLASFCQIHDLNFRTQLPQVHPPPTHPPPPHISAVQSLLHALFLPTPFKCTPRQGTHALEEALKVGALYRGCAIVNLRIPSPATDAQMPEDGARGRPAWSSGMGGLRGCPQRVGEISPLGDKKAECDDVPPVGTPSTS